MIWAYVISFVGGFFIALITGSILGIKKAKRYPGGSLGSGVGIGLIYHLSTGNTVICGILGVLGWVMYIIIFRNK